MSPWSILLWTLIVCVCTIIVCVTTIIVGSGLRSFIASEKKDKKGEKKK